MEDKDQAMPAVLSVSELTESIKRLLEPSFASVDVEGEISGWKVYPSGHAYFTLKDDLAQISAVIFYFTSDRFSSLHASLANGVKIKVRGSVSVYGPRGQYQLVVRRARLSGVGELMQKFIELKAKLEAEGLFDDSRKRPLPYMPRRIGIVTSEAGAVIHDMQRVFERRFPCVELRLFPATVQGVAAPESIVSGIRYFNASGWPELIIVARGGGSFEDLFCFNDENLVRAVAASDIPVISAVGHETDFTLCDFAADKRAGTPSIAAEIAVPVRDELLQRISILKNRLVSSLRAKGESYSQRLDFASAGLASSLRHASDRYSAMLERLAKSLLLLSPYSVLERGYSLVTDGKGAVVRSASMLNEGEVLSVRFSVGSAAVEVKGVSF